LKQADKLAVELDRDDARAALQKQGRQRAAPRPNLDDDVARRRRERVRNALQHAAVDEKVLAESLARARKAAALPCPSVVRVAQYFADTCVDNDELGI